MKTVLVIDDDQNVLNVITRIISDDGHRPVPATSFDEASDAICSLDSLDLAIIDFWLGDTSTVPVIDQLKDRFPKIPLIMISGGGQDVAIETSRALARLSGVTKFLQKPFRRAELLSLIEEAFS